MFPSGTEACGKRQVVCPHSDPSSEKMEAGLVSCALRGRRVWRTFAGVFAGYVLALEAEVQSLKHKFSALEGELAGLPGPPTTSSGDAEPHPRVPASTETGEGSWWLHHKLCPSDSGNNPTGGPPNAGAAWGSRSRSLAPASCRPPLTLLHVVLHEVHPTPFGFPSCPHGPAVFQGLCADCSASASVGAHALAELPL